MQTVVQDLSAPGVVRANWRPREGYLGMVVVIEARPAEPQLDRWCDAGQFGDLAAVELSRGEDSVLLELVRTG